MTRPIWLLLPALVLCACPPPIDTGDGGEDNVLTVGPAGGLFLRNGYGVNVPAGAFDDEQQIFVTIVDTGIPEVPERKRISFGYRLSPASLVPKAALTLYLPWIDERLVAGVDPNSYDMRRQQGADAYLSLPGVKTDFDPAKVVEAQTDKLGLFWVTSPSQPNIDRLEIDPGEATLRTGDMQAFTAQVISPTGEMVDAPVSWSVVPPRVGTITAEGTFTAIAPGVATITAASGTRSATATVYVHGTTVGPVTFGNENPFPTGNDLHGGAFAPLGLGTVYAGGNGTVLVESATGDFTRVFSTPGVTFYGVAGTSLDDAVAIGDTGAGGVLLQFKGSAAPPVARVFQPTDIENLVALWFDGTHGMGVGAGNQVVIFRDGAWTTEYHPSFEQLLSVIGDGAGGFTVVGDLGSIYRWDPARAVWDSLYDTRLSVKLDVAQLTSIDGEAWAVGANQLWHFVGTGWVAEPLPAVPRLSKATALGLFDDRLFVGGVQELEDPLPEALGAVLVRSVEVSSDGGVEVPVWTAQQLRGQQVARSLFGQGAEGRLVGDLGAVWKWDHAALQFVERSRGFQGDVVDLAVTSDDLIAAVNECETVACHARVGKVMHRSSTGFAELGTFPTTEPVVAMVARNSNEVLVSSLTHLWLWNGSGWAAVPVDGLNSTLTDLTWCGGTLWGATSAGEIFRGTATAFNGTGSITGSPLTSLHCPTSDELWVAGDSFLASRALSGSGQTWVQTSSDTVAQAPWYAVWSPGVGEAFAFGDALFGVYWNSAELVAQQSTGPIGVDVTTAMWGNQIDNLYMTGLSKLPTVFGFMLRFDGVAWTLVDSGAQRKGTALTGTGTQDIWLGTQGGGVLRAVHTP